MRTINVNTKRGDAYLNAYNRSNKNSLAECYTRCSTAKTRAEALCRKTMREENGNGFKIISFNCNFFTCGWITPDGLRVETVGGSFLVA